MATREDFVEYIDKKLSPHFTKNEEGNLWTCEKQVSSGNQVIVVNGQRYDQPAQLKTIKICVELVGDGCLKEESGDIPFVQVRFFAIDGDETRYLCPETCLYYDDNEYFDGLIKEFFGI